MGEFYLVKTYFGDRVLPKGTKIGVQLKDGSFQLVPVEDAKIFAGKSSTLFEKKYIDIPADELEQRLMQVKEGPFSYYRQAKMLLHETCEEKEEQKEKYTPKLSTILKRTHQESGQALDAFIDEAHLALQENAARHGFETVKKGTVMDWYIGREGTVAPEDWRNYAGLAKLAEKYTSASEFLKFNEDYHSYTQEPENNRFMKNLHYAYKYYRKQKSKFGKKTSSIIKKASKTRRNYGQKRVISVEHDQAIEDFIMQNFYKDIDSNHVATALLEVLPVHQNGTGKNQECAEENGTSTKGVYVAKNGKFEIDVQTKTQAQIAKDVAILERIFLNKIFYYTFQTTGQIAINQQTYINFLIEERIRKNQISKRFLGLEPGEVKEAQRMATREFSEIFESQTANEFFKLKQDSFQNMRDTYNSAVYFFPKLLEEFINSRENLARMQTVDPPEKREAKEKWNERMKQLQTFVSENKTQTEQLSLNLGIRGLITERVYEALPKLINKTLNQQFIIEMLTDRYTPILAQVRQTPTPQNVISLAKLLNYNNKEITEVLTRYSLDEFIKEDPELECQKILYN